MSSSSPATPTSPTVPETTALITPPSAPDDEPTVHPSLHRYITGLTDTHKTYIRFFSALLIPQDSHPQFFTDLRHFREQPQVIYLLAPGSSDGYREVSRAFVGSRFAHPWCRVKSDFGEGWRRASWVGGGKNATTGKKEREMVRKEEERLHRLLVPIWIAMRRRMFPGDGVVEDWIASDDERQGREKKEREEKAAQQAELEASSQGDAEAAAATKGYPELGFAIKTPDRPAEPDRPEPDQGAAEAASKMFIGAAMAAFVMSDKRVKKYVQKKLLKKK